MLERLLPLLQRPDVREIVLCSGKPPQARVGDTLQPMSSTALSSEQVEQAVAGTALAFLVGEAREIGMALGQLVHDGETYAAQAQSEDGLLEVRIARAGRSQVTDAPASRPTAAIRRATEDAPPAPRHAPRKSVRPASAPIPQKAKRRTPTPRPAPKKSPAPRRDIATAVPRSKQGPAQLRLLERVLAEARDVGASDVHVASNEPPRVRRGGQLEPHGAPIPHEQVVAMLTSLLPPERLAEVQSRGYADFAVDSAGGGRLRANVTRTRGGWKGCFRLVAAAPSSLAALGLPEELARVAMYHQGLVVISGPSGSGKTTTLASLVAMFNETRPVHVITVEDPVEIVHPAKLAILSQREVGKHTRTFGSALKGALRQDPDVIAIGELRDRETVEMALSAAETGHLVLATMSTPSGARTIDRLIDMFPPDVQSQVRATLAGALKMVIAQRLVPTFDGRQVVAAELITGGVPLWALIRDNKLFQLPSLLQRGRALGMIRIDDSLAALVARGEVTLEVARRYADDPKALGAPAPPAAQPSAPEPAKKGEGLGGALGRFFGKKDP